MTRPRCIQAIQRIRITLSRLLNALLLLKHTDHNFGGVGVIPIRQL